MEKKRPEREYIRDQIKEYIKVTENHIYGTGVAFTYIRRELTILWEESKKDNPYGPTRIPDVGISLEATARNVLGKMNDPKFANFEEMGAQPYIFNMAFYDLLAISLGHPAPAEFGAYLEARDRMGLKAC